MKKIYLSLFVAALFISRTGSSQHVQWLTSSPVNYNLNPEMPQQPACISGTKIFAARMVDFALSFGPDTYGSTAIDCYDLGGNLLWSYAMGPKLLVETLTADANGNVTIGGSYMETLTLNGTDSMQNTGSVFDINLFLISLDASGNQLWKRNVTLTHPDALELSALGIDPQNNCWYGLMYFDSISIKRLDSNGNDQQSHLITGTRTMHSFSFDPFGNLFVAGSSGSTTINVNGFTANVPEPYMMFVTRINAAGTASWIQLAHDVTFQSPHIVATANGDAIVGGTLMDPTSFGSIVFNGVQWVYDMFLTRVDSMGNFSWGVEVPQTPNITGDFSRGKNNFFDLDAAGNVYLTGTVRGSVDWGNGVVSAAGTIPSQGISIISFDGNGSARWQVTGSATGFVTPYSLCVAGQDECYFACSAVGTATFDSLTTNQGGGYAFVLGKIDSSSSAGVNESYAPDGFLAFPNPAINQLTIYNRQSSGNLISIYNLMGELVFESAPDASNSRHEIKTDVSNLTPGIYFVQVGHARTKIIVQ